MMVKFSSLLLLSLASAVSAQAPPAELRGNSKVSNSRRLLPGPNTQTSYGELLGEIVDGYAVGQACYSVRYRWTLVQSPTTLLITRTNTTICDDNANVTVTGLENPGDPISIVTMDGSFDSAGKTTRVTVTYEDDAATSCEAKSQTLGATSLGTCSQCDLCVANGELGVNIEW
jgi:hypothetical protein